MRPLLLFAAAILLTGCEFDIDDFGPSDRFQTDFHYTWDMQPGGKLSLETGNGSVEIAGWDQNKVEISGAKYGSTEAIRSCRASSAPLCRSRCHSVSPSEFHPSNRAAAPVGVGVFFGSTVLDKFLSAFWRRRRTIREAYDRRHFNAEKPARCLSGRARRPKLS